MGLQETTDASGKIIVVVIIVQWDELIDNLLLTSLINYNRYWLVRNVHHKDSVSRINKCSRSVIVLGTIPMPGPDRNRDMGLEDDSTVDDYDQGEKQRKKLIAFNARLKHFTKW